MQAERGRREKYPLRKARRGHDRIWRRLKAAVRVRWALRRLRANLHKPLVIGFWIHRNEALGAGAVRPGAVFLRFGFLSRDHCWRHEEVHEFLLTVAAMVTHARPTVIVWGIRDKANGHDLSSLFPDLVRIEASMLGGPPAPGTIETGFMLNREGIYFAGRAPSDCEAGLQELTLGYAKRNSTAHALIEHVRRTRTTKYPLGKAADVLLPGSLLVLGQVNGDQAIEETVTVGKTNREFVSWLRAERPVESVAAWYYKPHPRNLRGKAEIEAIKRGHTDLTVIDPGVNIHALFEQKPRVAVMTSGAGLEAALHGCEVYTFGISFYSNFGFTIDHFDCPRRTNRLTAEDVAAFMWIDRTVYVDPKTRRPVPVERVFGLNSN